MKVFLALWFLFLLLACSVAPQRTLAQAQPQPDPIQQQLDKYSEQGNYLAPRDLLLKEVNKGETDKNRWTQILAWHEGYIGNYYNAVNFFHAAWPTPKVKSPTENEEKIFLNVIKIESAIDGVCGEVRDHEIVIINENHHHPQHRAFGRKILKCMMDAGFMDFALETIGENDSDLNQRAYVSLSKTGYYAKEPQMAGLINDALKMGFKIHRYESTASCGGCSMEDAINLREEEEAQNLAEIIKQIPSRKVFIWVGFSHAYKRQLKKDDTRTQWMAARLWKKTGLEPFSIEQLSEQTSFNGTQPAFESINKIKMDKAVYVDLRQAWNNFPVIYKSSLRKTDVENGSPAIDAIIVHPHRVISDKRNKWIETSNVLNFKLERAKQPADQTEYLVQIYHDADIEDRVPLDQCICRTDGPCELLGPSGTYTVRVWNAEKVLSTSRKYLSSKRLNHFRLVN